MFNIGDKVVCVSRANDSSATVATAYNGPRPSLNKVYVVSDCWETDIGPQCFFIGFGNPPWFNGYKTGWMCKHFRKLDDIKAENKTKQVNSTSCTPT